MWMFQLVSINKQDANIYVEFTSEIPCSNLTMELRFKDMERFIGGQAYTYFHPIEVISEHTLHSAVIPIKIIAQKSKVLLKGDQLVWLCVMIDQQDYSIIGNETKDKVSLNLSDFVKLTSGYSKKNELNFKITSKTSGVSIESTSHESDLLFRLDTPFNQHELFLRKRVYKDAGVHSQSIPLLKLGEFYKLSKDSFDINEFIDEETIYDFCVVNQNDGLYLESFVKVKSGFTSIIFNVGNKNYSAELYSTKKGNLALKITRVYLTNKIDRIQEIEPGIYELMLTKQMDGNASICRLNKMAYISQMDSYLEYKTLPLRRNNENESSIILNLNDLFGDIETNYEQRYRIIIKSSDNLLFKVGLKETLEIAHPLERSIVAMEGEKVFNLYLRNKQENYIKVGVLGSCYSRSQFNSRKKFFNNKDYKTIFNVAYGHFWPSIISMVSEPIPYDKEIFQDVDPKKLLDIERELNKLIFPEVKEAKVDYLLVDFYVDAIHGVRLFENGSSIGVNPSIRATGYYKNVVLKNTEQFDYRNPNFFEFWKISCDKFLNQIKEFLPEERIVLNTGGFTDRYYDENREVRSFIDDKIISRKNLITYNSLWERMNNYFLTKAPKAKLIDMKKYGYIGDITHPSPFGPHHYESAFYRGLTGELARVVTFDKARS
jgi:hypothetical protein